MLENASLSYKNPSRSNWSSWQQTSGTTFSCMIWTFECVWCQWRAIRAKVPSNAHRIAHPFPVLPPCILFHAITVVICVLVITSYWIFLRLILHLFKVFLRSPLSWGSALSGSIPAHVVFKSLCLSTVSWNLKCHHLFVRKQYYLKNTFCKSAYFMLWTKLWSSICHFPPALLCLEELSLSPHT